MFATYYNDPAERIVSGLRVLILNYIKSQSQSDLKKIAESMKNPLFKNSPFLRASLSSYNYDIFCRPFESQFNYSQQQAATIACHLFVVFCRNLDSLPLGDLLNFPIFHPTKIEHQFMIPLFKIVLIGSKDLLTLFLEQVNHFVNIQFFHPSVRDNLLLQQNNEGFTALSLVLDHTPIVNVLLQNIFTIKANPVDRYDFLYNMLHPMFTHQRILWLIKSFEKHYATHKQFGPQRNKEAKLENSDAKKEQLAPKNFLFSPIKNDNAGKTKESPRTSSDNKGDAKSEPLHPAYFERIPSHMKDTLPQTTIVNEMIDLSESVAELVLSSDSDNDETPSQSLRSPSPSPRG